MQGILHRTTGGRYDLELLNGDVIEGVVNEAKAPTEVLLQLHLVDNALASFEVVGHLYMDTKVKRVAMIRVLRDDLRITEEWDNITSLAKEVEQYFHSINQHWDVVEVKPFVIVEENTPLGLQFNFGMPHVRSQLLAIDPDFDRFNYTCGIGGTSSGGWAGIAWTGAGRCWLFSNGIKFRVAAHEIAHNFGLEHDWQGSNPYGGETIQGFKSSTHNAAAMIYLDQISDHEIADINSGAAFLIPVECKAVDARAGEYRAVRVTKNNQINILSIHRNSNQTLYGKGKLIDGNLWVHTYDPSNRMSYRTVQIDRYSGESPIMLPNGTKVEVTGKKDGVVRIAVDSDERPAFPEWPNVPVNIHNMDEAAEGLWYSPTYSYQGISLHVKGDQVQGYWFTHTPNKVHNQWFLGTGDAVNDSLPSNLHNAKRTWRVLDGTIKDGVVLFDVINTEGRKIEVEGQARLYLVGPNKGMFKFRCNTFGIDHLVLERLSHRGDEGALTGLFQTGELEGISAITHGSDTQAYHFHYDKDGKPEWEIYTGRPGHWEVYRPVSFHKNLHGDIGGPESSNELPGPRTRLM